MRGKNVSFLLDVLHGLRMNIRDCGSDTQDTQMISIISLFLRQRMKEDSEHFL